MDSLILVVVGLLLYAVGIGMFIRFASFIHRCDNEMKSMLGKSSRTTRRPSRPRLRAA